MSEHEVHTLTTDPADEVMGRLTDVRVALEALEDATMAVMCPGCDPDGERTRAVRDQLRDRYAVDAVDADMLLANAADVRTVLMVLLAPRCDHDQ